VFIVKEAGLYVENMAQELVKMKSQSCGWPENDLFSGDCVTYDYLNKY
jgi:hypothetical protein